MEAPELVTLVGVTVHDVLLVVRLTAPVKPLTAVTVIDEVPAAPALTVTDVGLAVTVKSWTTNVWVTEWDKEALVPVAPMWYVPDDEKVHERVEVPEPVTLVGERTQEVLFVVRLMTPANPFTALIVIVEVPAALTSTLTLVGLALMVKSCTRKVAVKE